MSGRLAPAAPTKRRGANLPLLVLQGSFALLILLVVIQGLWQATLQHSIQEELPASTDAASPVPSAIAGLPLTQSMTGPQALAELAQLHGRDVGLKGGFVAHYGPQATIWVGQAAGPEQAEALIQAMAQRIRAGTAYFSDLQEISLDGQPAYTVVGQGQRHYFYRQADKTIWLAAPTGREEQFLREASRLLK